MCIDVSNHAVLIHLEPKWLREFVNNFGQQDVSVHIFSAIGILMEIHKKSDEEQPTERNLQGTQRNLNGTDGTQTDPEGDRRSPTEITRNPVCQKRPKTCHIHGAQYRDNGALRFMWMNILYLLYLWDSFKSQF